MSTLHWWSSSEEETLRFGESLGRALAPPAWLGLTGSLGAGKTRLAQGVARGLGFAGRVRSPSFVLEHRYKGRVGIRHLDLYRLESAPEDLESSWLDGHDDVILVEWAERVLEPPDDALWIRMSAPQDRPADASGRWIRLDWSPRSGRIRDFPLPSALGLRSLRARAAEGRSEV